MTNNFPPISAALESKGTRISVIRRCAALPEALAFSVFVMAYIWRLQSSGLKWWIVFPAWLMLSFVFHRDTPKTLGWRADNFWTAMRQVLVPFAVFIAAISIIGLFLGALQRLPSHLIESRRLIGYFAFCVLQEVGLQSFLMNRLLAALEKPVHAALIAGAIFAIMHWPNPVLMPLTFIGGTTLCWLFARERNIIPLAIGQAILGSIVWWAIPVALHHGMRVGPGYYSFQLPTH
ncbi:MAG TPA: CPBP family intramembrane glutamic endopeptidase [Candidatus Acidoferrum sp.]|nr:CPBP family intramembrane glutamic endopeptidase [Candidatus Acidoferrum sp.]